MNLSRVAYEHLDHHYMMFNTYVNKNKTLFTTTETTNKFTSIYIEIDK